MQCQINRNQTRFSTDFCHSLIDHPSTINQIIILHNQWLQSASVAKEIQTIESISQVPQNQSQYALHMTDFSTHRSTHPAPLFPIALNGVFYAGSVKISLHPFNDCKHYVLACSTEIKPNLDSPSLKSCISFRDTRRCIASE